MNAAQHWFAVTGSGTSLLRLSVLCGLMWLAGRAIAQISSREYPAGFFRHPNYMAAGTAAVWVTAVTCMLKFLGKYSFATAFALLAAAVMIGLWRSPALRLALRGRKLLGWDFAFYAAGVGALFVLVPIPQFSELANTSIYLQQGFNFFLPQDPALSPHFGGAFTPPLVYLGLPISAVFALLSHDDAFLFYAFGEYWANVIIGPTVLLGAYLVLRRLFPWWAAIGLALGFCTTALDVKVWSLRGESLAWIVAFAFLLGFFDVLERMRERAPLTVLWRPVLILALLYAVLGLTHGITAFVVTGFAAGFGVFSLGIGSRRDVFYAGCIATLFVGVFGIAYVAAPALVSSHPRGTQTASDALKAGEPDPAADLDVALGLAPPGFVSPPVHAAPPYVSPIGITKMVMVLPLAATFRPGLDRYSVPDFPDAAIAHLSSVPRLEAYSFYILLGLCLALQLSPFRRWISPARRAVFWGALLIFVLIVLVTVYLDFNSVSRYPLTGIRRTFVYLRCSYFLAVSATLLDPLVAAALAGRVIARTEVGARLCTFAQRRAFLLTAAAFAIVAGVLAAHTAGESGTAFVVDLWSPTGARTELYYDRGHGLSEQEAHILNVGGTECAGPLSAAGAENCPPMRLVYPLPSGRYIALRLDVQTPDGKFFLRNPHLTNANGKTLRELSWKEFIPNEGAAISLVAGGAALVTPGGDFDTQLYDPFPRSPLPLKRFSPRILWWAAACGLATAIVVALSFILFAPPLVRRWHAAGGVHGAAFKGAVACFAVVLWFDASTQPALSEPTTFKSLWERRKDPLGNGFADELAPLFQAVAYVRDRTQVGELVITNCFSENIFWFLSSGRYAAFDGWAMYQLPGALRDGNRRIRQFSEFLATADLSRVAGFKFKYLLLYRVSAMTSFNPDLVNYGDPPHMTNFPAFAASPWFRQAYANSYFVVLERLDAPRAAAASALPAYQTRR